MVNLEIMRNLSFLIVLIGIASCNNNEGTLLWRVWYAVQVPPNYDFKITYNSDKYFDSGTRDTVFVHDSSYVQQLEGFWIGQRLQENKEEGYYVDIQVDSLTPYDGELGVFVYANDTNLLDSFLYPYGTKEIRLQGDIPLNF